VTDRELLELAAKAAGIDLEWREWRTGRIAEFGIIKYTRHEGFWIGGKQWNPLTDDGDALRLAVKILYCDQVGAIWAEVNAMRHKSFEDEVAATRRAIVRAAAEIGRKMP
jgi:hypothetical protein